MYSDEISIYKDVLLYTYVLLLKRFILSGGMFLENIWFVYQKNFCSILYGQLSIHNDWSTHILNISNEVSNIEIK